MHFWTLLAHLSLELGMFQTKVVEKIKIHISCSKLFFFLESHAVYEIMWRTIVEPARPQLTSVSSMRIACWTPKATNTHLNYAIHIAFSLEIWLNERALCDVIRTLPVLLCVLSLWDSRIHSNCLRLTLFLHSRINEQFDAPLFQISFWVSSHLYLGLFSYTRFSLPLCSKSSDNSTLLIYSQQGFQRK